MKHPQRKYRVAMLSFFLVTAGYLATHFSDRLKESYFTFVGAVSTVLTLYGAANVSNKWVLAKNGILTPADNTAVVINPQSQIVQVPGPTAQVHSVPSVAVTQPVPTAQPNPSTNQPLNPQDVSGA